MFELFNIITVQIWTAKCDFNKDYCNESDDSNFNIDNYILPFTSCETAVVKSVRQQLK